MTAGGTQVTKRTTQCPSWDAYAATCGSSPEIIAVIHVCFHTIPCHPYWPVFCQHLSVFMVQHGLGALGL